MGTAQDWGYKTEPQEGACQAYRTKGCAWPRGRVLGGSSSINAMFYVRGNKADYDEWAAAGNKGWSYDEILPYFKKSENFVGELNESMRKYHGAGGYLNVASGPELHDFEKLILSAGLELGIANISDYVGASQMGIGSAYSTIADGKRFSTARAFLATIKDRPNLHVIKNTLATKIVFKPGTKKVTSILLNKDGEDFIVNISKELILSGGSVNSPQLLILSGIGPEKHLKELGIDIVANLPVGENLQDHVFVPAIYTAPAPNEAFVTLESISQAIIDQILYGKGVLSSTHPHRIFAFVNVTDSKSMTPSTQYHFLMFPANISNMLDIFEKHDLVPEVTTQFREMNSKNLALIIYNTLLKPKSLGRIVLKSKNPFEHPLIYANYFEDIDDLNIIIKAFKEHIFKFEDTKSLQSLGFKLKWIDLEVCKQFDKNTDEFLKCYSRHMTFSLYHPTTTCKMGQASDKTTVVDDELKVHGVQGLRVIDASIMPSVIRGNTNAPVIMIGEKGSDMIKNTWLDKSTKERIEL